MLTDNNIENLIEGVMRHGPAVLDRCVSHADELVQYRNYLKKEFLDYEIPKLSVDRTCWLIPDKYKTMDIEEFLANSCPKQNYDRLTAELELFHKHGMIDMLRAMKYIVDTLRKNNVLWGVGRGSSVASYVLYLIGVHKIDPIKYELPIDEFFKGEQNG